MNRKDEERAALGIFPELLLGGVPQAVKFIRRSQGAEARKIFSCA